MSKKRGVASRPKAEEAVVPALSSGSAPPSAANWIPVAIAVGLGAFVLIRTFRDGTTYEYDNLYFSAGIALLFALWGIYTLVKGETLRFGRHVALLGGFLLVAALTGLGTVDADSTIRSLIVWTGHVLLFVLFVNALRTRVSVTIVLSAFVAALLAEVVYSFFHYHYMLPFVRKQMMENPSLILAQFGTTTLSPELIHRLNVNRAFGSFLLANALAAFLILGIPYLLGEAANFVWRFRAVEPSASPEDVLAPRNGNAEATFVGSCLGLMVLAVISATAAYFLKRWQIIQSGTVDWSAAWPQYLILMVALPMAVGAAVALTVTRRGVHKGLLTVGAFFLAVTFAGALMSLWLTLSRGGILALAVASTLGCVLLWLGRDARRERSRVAVKLATGAAVALVVATSLWSASSHAQQPAPDPAQQIVVPGVDLSVKDLSSPATFWLRVAYWRIAAKMAADNFWTGVGLDNYGALYTHYQRVGDPPVRTAHNDYLQIFAETGVFGFALFVGFWGHFLWWGARRILREPVPGERWALAGLYTGVLAFLVHANVDFNFYNPSLGALAFAAAGMFLARSGDPAAVASARVSRVVVALLLAVTAFAAWTGWDVYRAHALTGSDKDNQKQFYLANTLAQGNPRTRLGLDVLASLFPDRNDIEAFGAVYLPQAGSSGNWTKVEPGRPLDAREAAIAVVSVTNPEAAVAKLKEAIDRRMDTLERAHEVYPYDAKTAITLFSWHDFLLQISREPAAQQEHALAMLRWSEEAVKRNPASAWYRTYYGNALLRRGRLESDSQRGLEYLYDGIEQYRLATELYPTSRDLWVSYADNLEKFAAYLKQSRRVEESQQLLRKAKDARAQAEKLQSSD